MDFLLRLVIFIEKDITMKRLTKEDFIEKAIKVHGNKYDYSKVEYKNNKQKVCIICPEHGEFWMKPNCHLDGKQGCPKCGHIKRSIARRTKLSEFMEKAYAVHGNKYDYSKVEYVNTETNVCIICPEHGEFWQTPHNHLIGQGCSKCYGNNKKTKDDFVKKSMLCHGDKYDYSLVNYTKNSERVCIICPKHGEFWQVASEHMRGHGCPKCYVSKLEDGLREFLRKNNFTFVEQKTFNGLKYKKKLRFDFYLPEYNVAIECQGEQHYVNVNFGNSTKNNSNKKFDEQKERDELKKKYCEDNGILLLFFSISKNKKYDNKLITSKKVLKNIILKNK